MRKIFILSGVLIYLIISSFPALAGAKPPEKGDVLPDIILAVPQQPELQQYLGLSGKSSFSISQVKADVVLIEIFSMYCPYCQREAPAVNTLHRKIASSSRLKEKIKLLKEEIELLRGVRGTGGAPEASPKIKYERVGKKVQRKIHLKAGTEILGVIEGNEKIAPNTKVTIKTDSGETITIPSEEVDYVEEKHG